jgi:hypothetical protein
MADFVIDGMIVRSDEELLHNHLVYAHRILFKRYLAMCESVVNDVYTGRLSIENAKWMCRTGIENVETFPIDKLSRWLAFVQTGLIFRGVTTVDAERDYSRPLFQPAYRYWRGGVPPTQEMPTLPINEQKDK